MMCGLRKKHDKSDLVDFYSRGVTIEGFDRDVASQSEYTLDEGTALSSAFTTFKMFEDDTSTNKQLFTTGDSPLTKMEYLNRPTDGSSVSARA